nr:amino acid permease [Candidatus Sarmatiella mevalonica]
MPRTLGPLDLVLFGSGSIIGSGVFVLTGIVAATCAGPAVSLSYLIAGLVCIFVGLSYIELATAIPTSGSIYTYSCMAFGELFGWMIGSVIVLELGFASATVAAGWSGYARSILFSATGMELPEALCLSPMEGGVVNIIGLIIPIILGYVLYLGTQNSKKLTTILSCVTILVILLFVFFAYPNIDYANYTPFMPFGFDKVIFGSSILFFAYTGFGNIATTVDECKNPKRDIVVGLIGALLVAAVLFIAVAFALTGIDNYQNLNAVSSLANALAKHGNNAGAAVVAIGAVCGMTTVLMSQIYAQSRICYVVAKDGLLPQGVTKIHPKHKSPYVSILIFTLLAAVGGGFCQPKLLAQMSSMGSLIDYMTISLIVVLFRKRMPNIERPFKCPAVYLVSVLAYFACGYLLYTQMFDETGLSFAGLCLLAWFAFVLLVYFITKSRVRKAA